MYEWYIFAFVWNLCLDQTVYSRHTWFIINLAYSGGSRSGCVLRDTKGAHYISCAAVPLSAHQAAIGTHQKHAFVWHLDYEPLARYVKLRVAHAPGMLGTFSPSLRVSDPDMHHGTCLTHVPWCMPGSLTSGFLWSRWRGKRSRHSRSMRNPQFYVSGKRPMECFFTLQSSPTEFPRMPCPS